ncbi:MAG: cell division topological specificity factor MinE [Azospirillaceae bacterium]|nr:cell division topological specificity factor MinE [Azospirillaceae bacterium]
MSIFSLFRAPKKASGADQAKERLQIVLAHERAGRDSPDFLPQLQKELLDVIKKYVSIDDDKVAVKLDRASGCSMLEVNVELPAPAKGTPRSGAAPAKVASA